MTSVPASFYDLQSDGPASVKVGLVDAVSVLEEVKQHRLFIHSIEGYQINENGNWISDLTISKMGLCGEDNFQTLEQHYAFDTELFERAQKLECECVFEIWLDDEHSLKKKDNTK